MLNQPAVKYRPSATVNLPDRQWPSRRITAAPVWMSTDLRDGNQSLIEPMSIAQKLRFFQMLVQIGFKEIEIAFPSASDTEFQFVRELIEGGHIPDDVTIEVLTQAREDLIRRTIESVEGARSVIVHLYNPVSPSFRRIVFGKSRAEILALASAGTQLIRELTDARPATQWRYEYSPETFSMAELDFSLEVCDAVSDIWCAGRDSGTDIIINLPATVEVSTPNVYADQIEWMHRHLKRRAQTVLSVHPHNDRGTGIAAAELALMAGADRVEGCLFGNGERTGNVDIVTLALNLYTQGISPQLDFSDIDAVRAVVEDINRIPVHPRHPYAGDLVHTAFSGSHQDAIRKGFAQQQSGQIWEVPYLPIDPQDIGRSYDAVIRVNSQSGKGGMSYLLEQAYGIRLPRRMQIALSREVQQLADASGAEVSAQTVFQVFEKVYLQTPTHLAYQAHQVLDHRTSPSDAAQLSLRTDLLLHGQPRAVIAAGSGFHDACQHMLNNLGFNVQSAQWSVMPDKHQHGNVYVIAEIHTDQGYACGVAHHQDAEAAAISAVFAAVSAQIPQREIQAAA
jgi:2-isopropylmalate synthase